VASGTGAPYIPRRPDRTKFYFQNFAVPWTLEDVNDTRHRVAAVLRDWGIDDLRGRGLILIEDAARAMGWRAVREGKVVWARF